MLGNERCERLMGPLMAFMFEDGVQDSSNLYNRVYEAVVQREPIEDPTGDSPRYWFYDAFGVLRFAWSMWKKLRANRHKAHWTGYGDFDFYRQRIDDELSELDLAHSAMLNARFKDDPVMTDGSWMMEEAADVGNFAMMIHERTRLGCGEPIR